MIGCSIGSCKGGGAGNLPVGHARHRRLHHSSWARPSLYFLGNRREALRETRTLTQPACPTPLNNTIAPSFIPGPPGVQTNVRNLWFYTTITEALLNLQFYGRHTMQDTIHCTRGEGNGEVIMKVKEINSLRSLPNAYSLLGIINVI